MGSLDAALGPDGYSVAAEPDCPQGNSMIWIFPIVCTIYLLVVIRISMNEHILADAMVYISNT
jgi:hypothetical protein